MKDHKEARDGSYTAPRKMIFAVLSVCLAVCVIGVIVYGIASKTADVDPADVDTNNVLANDTNPQKPSSKQNIENFPNETLGFFTLSVDSGIQFEISNDKTVKSVRFADQDAADRFDASELEGKPVYASLRTVLEEYDGKGGFEDGEKVNVTFDENLSRVGGEKIGIVDTMEKFFVEKQKNPRLLVGQTSASGEEPVVEEYVGLGDVKQLIGEYLGWPSDLSNTFAMVFEDENGHPFYYLEIIANNKRYGYTVDAITGTITDSVEIDTTPETTPQEPLPNENVDPETAARIALDDARLPYDTEYWVKEANDLTYEVYIRYAPDTTLLYIVYKSDGHIGEYKKILEEN